MRYRPVLALVALSLMHAAACGSNQDDLFAGGAVCTPGQSQACTCALAVAGTQICLADGTGYGTCSCENPGLGGSAGAAGDASADAPSEGAAGHVSDAGDGAAGGAGSAADGGDGSAIATLGDACTKPGALACAGHAQKLLLLCDGAHWVSNGVCSGAQLCDTRPGITAGSCQNPVPQCIGHAPGEGICEGAQRTVCGPDLLTSTSVLCASAALCEAGKGDACAVCLNGDHQCQGANLMKCAPDHLDWDFDAACPSAALCDAVQAKCGTAVCSPNQYHCAGDVLEKCNGALTGFQQVQVCSPGLCDAAGKQCDVCQPGALSCINNSVATCDADGQSATTAPCPAQAPYCVGDGQCASCNEVSLPPPSQPLDLFFMLDTSGSMMGTNLSYLQQGVSSYVNDPAASGVWAAGNQFPIMAGTTPSCIASSYAATAVGWAALPNVGFAQWVNTLQADGTTPTVPALQGAVNACKARKQAQPLRSCAVIFATDGDPTECDPIGDAAKLPLGAIAADAWANGIAVYAVGFPNLTSLDILNYIAQQGGTGTPTVVQSGAQFASLLKTIQGSAISCSFPKPTGVVDSVQFVPGSGPNLALAQVIDASQCAGDAWYYDNNSSPSHLLMCPATCNRFKTDPTAQLDIKLCQ